jgi:hypothetical protein
MRVLMFVIPVLLLVATSSGLKSTPAQISSSGSIVRCEGVSASLLKGWDARVRRGAGGFFTLTLASFPLVAEADAVDEQSAKRMSRGDLIVLLIGYGAASHYYPPAFKGHAPLPLTVQRMTVYRMFEHLPRGHRLAQVTFIARGGA